MYIEPGTLGLVATICVALELVLARGRVACAGCGARAGCVLLRARPPCPGCDGWPRLVAALSRRANNPGPRASFSARLAFFSCSRIRRRYDGCLVSSVRQSGQAQTLPRLLSKEYHSEMQALWKLCWQALIVYVLTLPRPFVPAGRQLNCRKCARGRDACVCQWIRGIARAVARGGGGVGQTADRKQQRQARLRALTSSRQIAQTSPIVSSMVAERRACALFVRAARAMAGRWPPASHCCCAAARRVRPRACQRVCVLASGLAWNAKDQTSLLTTSCVPLAVVTGRTRHRVHRADPRRRNPVRAGEARARVAVLLAPCVGSAAWSATLAKLGVRGQDGRCCMQVRIVSAT